MLSQLQGTTVQEIADAAKKSGAEGEDLDYLASLGSFGLHKSHISSSIIKQYCKPGLASPAPYTVKIPMMVKSSTDSTVQLADFSMFLPTDWVASLSQYKDPSVIDSVFKFNDVSGFWGSHDMQDPKLFGNPVMDSPDWKSTMTPCILHGDGGQFQRRDCLNVISFKSALSSVSTAFSFMLLAAVPKRCIATNRDNPNMDTMLSIWAILVWNFTCAFKGIHPPSDHLGKSWPSGSLRAKLAGKPLHKGFKLFLFGINPDLEFLQNMFWVKCHSFDDMCWLCPANKSDNPYTDFRPGSMWRRMCYTASQTRAVPATNHPIMQIPGVVTQTFCVESLHTNELGLMSHFSANVFFEQIYEKFMEGATNAVRLANLWKHILKSYVDNGISSSNRIGHLHLEMFCTPKAPHQHYPVFSGCKAREIRYLLPATADLCKKMLAKRPSSYTRHIDAAAGWLVKMYDVMENADMHPSAQEKVDFREAVDSFMMHYSALATRSQGKNEKRWNIVPKFHYSCHGADQFDYFNIVFQTAYGGETEVGLVSSLAHRCLDGTPAHKLSYKLCLKYMLGQHLRFCNMAAAVEDDDDWDVC